MNQKQFEEFAIKSYTKQVEDHKTIKDTDTADTVHDKLHTQAINKLATEGDYDKLISLREEYAPLEIEDTGVPFPHGFDLFLQKWYGALLVTKKALFKKIGSNSLSSKERTSVEENLENCVWGMALFSEDNFIQKKPYRESAIREQIMGSLIIEELSKKHSNPICVSLLTLGFTEEYKSAVKILSRDRKLISNCKKNEDEAGADGRSRFVNSVLYAGIEIKHNHDAKYRLIANTGEALESLVKDGRLVNFDGSNNGCYTLPDKPIDEIIEEWDVNEMKRGYQTLSTVIKPENRMDFKRKEVDRIMEYIITKLKQGTNGRIKTEYVVKGSRITEGLKRKIIERKIKSRGGSMQSVIYFFDGIISYQSSTKKENASITVDINFKVENTSKISSYKQKYLELVEAFAKI